jgi:hypothetical protein
MRLTDLDPRWLLKDGRRIGFIFRCPTRPEKCWQSCFEAAPPRREQWELFAAAFGIEYRSDEPRPDVQGCYQGAHWQIVGGIAAADFATLTVTPSLDGSAGGNWHGYITNGQIVGGV